MARPQADSYTTKIFKVSSNALEMIPVKPELPKQYEEIANLIFFEKKSNFSADQCIIHCILLYAYLYIESLTLNESKRQHKETSSFARCLILIVIVVCPIGMVCFRVQPLAFSSDDH